MSDSRLSVCLIAKNEEKNLDRALSSVKSVADEIIITDTGSTDNTISIAEKYGAKISHFDWCDDFAAARNFCFSRATSDWIFWLDADEELLPKSIDELRRCISRKDVFAYLILRQDLTDLSHPELYTEMWLDRLFRNHKDIHHVGRCHSQFEPPLPELAARQGQVVEYSQVRIRHYGYAGPQKEEKIRRGLKLLELELQDRPGQIYYQIELYRALLLLGDKHWKSVLNEAAENLRCSINADEPSTPLVGLMLETLLQLPPKELPKGFSSQKLRDLARKWFPRSAPLLWVLAKQDYQSNRFQQAEQRLRLLIQMGKEHSYDKTVGFDPHIFAEEAYLNLAVCLIRQAKLDEAEQILKNLTSSQSHRKAAEQNLRSIANLRRKDKPIRPRKMRRKRPN